MKFENNISDPIEIKVLLLRAKINQVAIARKVGVSASHISNVIKGRRSTKRVRVAIARAVGKRVSELWPPRPFKKAA
jgi:lambda repressor-like predicted transcriptional regulator